MKYDESALKGFTKKMLKREIRYLCREMMVLGVALNKVPYSDLNERLRGTGFKLVRTIAGPRSDKEFPVGLPTPESKK